MKKKKIVVGVIVVGLVGLGWIAWRSFAPGTDGSVFYGNVDIREVDLGFRVSGRVEKMAKDEGDRVTKGEVLAELDPAPYQHRLDSAKAELAAREAVRDLKHRGYRAEEISQARASVNERQATMENAQIELKRQKELLASRAVSKQDYDHADALLREVTARYNSAVQNLQLLEAGYRKEEIAQADADLEKALAAVQTAETDLGDTVLHAAEDGVVMTRAEEPGAIVAAGATVYTVDLQNPVWVRAYVSEPFLGLVHPGAAVEITTDLKSGKTYHGQIGYVSPRAEFTPKSVETPDLRTALVYRFRVIVSDADEALRQGMPVTVRLTGG